MHKLRSLTRRRFFFSQDVSTLMILMRERRKKRRNRDSNCLRVNAMKRLKMNSEHT